MTDDDKALVERLRWGAWYYEDPFDGKAYASDDPIEAADRIEALSAENERLSDQLEYAVGELSKYRAKYMVGTSPILEEKSDD